MTGVEVRVLGPFEVALDGRPVVLSGNRLTALLATLASAAGEVVSVETITAALWGADSPANVRGAVQTYVARLRQALGSAVIETHSSGYLLRVDPDRVDAVRFLRLAAVPPGAADEREALAAALDLWRTDTPFEGVESAWLAETEGSRLIERYLTTVERRVDLDLAGVPPAGLLDELRELTGRHPLRESLWARLIQALGQSGQRTEALAAYQTIRDRIADELGVDPGMDLQRLYADLTGTASDSYVPRQLPSDIGHFTGRAGALAALDALIPRVAAMAPGPVVVAALHGPGGIGKSALAVHWAHQVKDRFPDGQLFVDLRGYGPGEPIEVGAALDLLLRDLGVPGQQIPDDLGGRSALLRSMLADRRMLIVLDNARDAEQVRPLLPGSSNLVLITSRSQLRGLVARDGARPIALDQFTGAESIAFLARALGSTPHDVAALAELAGLCGHLPLALAVAAESASRQPAMSLRTLADQLGDERDRLDSLEVDADPSSNLRAVFSWSYQALHGAAARVFRLAGLLPGADFGASAAAALIGTTPAQTRRLLDRLVEAHLVEQRRPGRYQMHDLLRAYAIELATELEPAAERDAAIGRMLDFYLHSAAAARVALGRSDAPAELGAVPDRIEPLRFEAEPDAVAWFDTERQGLLAAVQLAAGTGQDRAAYQLATQLYSYLLFRYAVDDLLRSQQLGMAAARRTGDLAAQAAAANRLGGTYQVLGDHERARVHLGDAVASFAALGDDARQASALANLGTQLQALGRVAEAAERLEYGLLLARRVGSPNELTLVLNNLAMSYIQLRRYADAAEACREALEVPRTEGFRNSEPHLWDTLGLALVGIGNYPEAIDAYHRSLHQVRELGDRWGEAIVLGHLGVALGHDGQNQPARTSCLQALAIADELGIPDSPDLDRADLRTLIQPAPTAAHR